MSTMIPRECLVKGCQERALTPTGLRLHFVKRQVRDNMIIAEEGNLPHLWCLFCDMLVMWVDLNGSQTNTTQCVKGEENKRFRLE